jgi:tryptophanyl-tRNA synthetase
MAADILLYKATFVPVGEDQLPHLELARDIARRFNLRFGHVFPEPQAGLTNAPLILGLDGVNKMSKSLNNHIELAASPGETRERIMTAFTDPARRYRSDRGHPDKCNIYSLHRFFTQAYGHIIVSLKEDCEKAKIGCVECKQALAISINEALKDFRERRAEFAAKSGYVDEVLAAGAEKAQAIAKETITEVKQRIGLL